MTLTVLVANGTRKRPARSWPPPSGARPDARVVALCANGVDAGRWLEHEPSLSLLDIRMPGLSGL
jgi:CheY-like chemotaxis protein